MTEFVVVLVEPKIGGNVGAVARSMANFGLRDLTLVNAPELGDEAYRRAKHGGPVLRAAHHVP
ncbi:MAG: TrmH family RNA methyltransferase, partial [Thermoplasmata archaeon]